MAYDGRYLEAKRTVDDRAIDRRVRDRTLDELPEAPLIVEAGAGTGATVPRLLDWGVTAGTYRGIDRDDDVIELARERRADECGGERTEAGFRVDDLSVRFEQGDALAATVDDPVDLVVAQAFLDLVPLDDALDAFASLLRPGGLVYAPITFDGETVFQPDHPVDDAVVAAYHDAIDAEPGRDARAGRHLLDRCRERDGDLLAVGASDWVVYPPYPADERYFLGAILDFVADAVTDRVDGADDWLDVRRRQLDAGCLSYVAHGYDVLYRP
ncbi:class I SAM-dependent methyltransferase [Haloplanus aerogenes]|uniref:Class I SAM-dependent methyltransferase n=1 Tax=Haloplanus aerogenes TaxID=660522 RepID=A0A3M0CV20_9EURY|nr:class I SAM-dependent methyltransferase [Haloplanus aerogenes]RMB13212.1 methyltransferase family protein [Haloplanus aerogenes]